MTAPKRRPGRPTTTGTTPTRSMRLGSVYDVAKAKAERTGTRITNVIEAALEDYVMDTVTVPTDPAAYGRWLAGQLAGYAALVRRDERVELGDLERGMLVNAIAEMTAALESLD